MMMKQVLFIWKIISSWHWSLLTDSGGEPQLQSDHFPNKKVANSSWHQQPPTHQHLTPQVQLLAQQPPPQHSTTQSCHLKYVQELTVATFCMWRFSDLSIEWQKEENGFLRPHNAQRGCLNRSTMHTKHLHFTWSLTQSLPLYHVALPCTQNCSLPLLFSAPVCGRCHMALLPSFLGSELVGDHVACCHPAYFAAMLLVKGC